MVRINYLTFPFEEGSKMINYKTLVFRWLYLVYRRNYPVLSILVKGFGLRSTGDTLFWYTILGYFV